jgi:glycosyltransferase involved in cell wall biosynthesis
VPDFHHLVFVSLETWDDIWRRNQFASAELARRGARRKILFVTPPQDISYAVRRGRLAALRPPAAWSPEGLPNVVVTTPVKLLPSSLAVGRRVNAALLRRHIRSEMKRLGIQRPVLWINDHATHHLVGQLGESGVIYDITDDWISFDQAESLRQRIIAQDADLCRRADAVIVCSERLREMKRPMVPPDRLHLIPNGVNVEHYRCVLDDDGPLPDACAGWRKPVLGYTGTVHPDRVDVDLLAAIARAFPQGDVVLIGPNHLPPGDVAKLEACGNVRLLGPRPYTQLPQLMRGIDVCIVPHRMTAFVESLNPIKLWEYLAAGRPIVSTDVAGFRDYPKLVRLARSADEFVAAVERALDEPHTVRQQRRDEAAKHSWASRVDQIEAVMQQVTRAERAKAGAA